MRVGITPFSLSRSRSRVCTFSKFAVKRCKTLALGKERKKERIEKVESSWTELLPVKSSRGNEIRRKKIKFSNRENRFLFSLYLYPSPTIGLQGSRREILVPRKNSNPWRRKRGVVESRVSTTSGGANESENPVDFGTCSGVIAREEGKVCPKRGRGKSGQLARDRGNLFLFFVFLWKKKGREKKGGKKGGWLRATERVFGESETYINYTGRGVSFSKRSSASSVRINGMIIIMKH